MLSVYSGYVKGCCKSLSCKSGLKLSTRDQLFEGRSKALNLGFFFMCSTALSLIFFCAILRASNHQLVHKKNKTEMLFKLSNHTLTLGYLDPALNNLAHGQGYLGLRPKPEAMNGSLINPKMVVIATVI